MGGNFSIPNTFVTGETADASKVNSNFTAIVNNFTPSGLDDYSLNNAQMQSTVDPYPASSESLATSGAGELERIRYQILQILMAFKASTAYWYLDIPLFAPKFNYVTKTANYTLTGDDYVILADVSGGAFTLTLPASSGLGGKTYVVKKTDTSANAVTIDGNASETIDGSATWVLSILNDYIIIQSDNINWKIIGGMIDQPILRNPRIATQGAIIDGGGDSYIDFVESSAPVNRFLLRNADTTIAPSLEANGTDANIGIKIIAKGAGRVELSRVLGTWDTSKIKDTVYQASTDLIVCANLVLDAANSENTVTGYTDSANPPTTVIDEDTTAQGSNAVIRRASITMPVRKNDYWKVAHTLGVGSWGTVTIKVIPIGG